jgi:hypothetical protein
LRLKTSIITNMKKVAVVAVVTHQTRVVVVVVTKTFFVYK